MTYYYPAMQSELLQQHVCNAYGQVLCNEPGKIWVCYHDQPHGFHATCVGISGIEGLLFVELNE